MKEASKKPALGLLKIENKKYLKPNFKKPAQQMVSEL